MPPAGYFIDTNLFLLFVVGRVGRGIIAKHRRLRRFTVEDYDNLMALLDRVNRLYVTPNTLTETSNLLQQHGEPERSRLFDGLKFLIQESQEVVVPSAEVSQNNSFSRLGLTDAALLEVVSSERPLVTADLALYLEASKKGQEAAVYFSAGDLTVGQCGIIR